MQAPPPSMPRASDEPDAPSALGAVPGEEAPGLRELIAELRKGTLRRIVPTDPNDTFLDRSTFETGSACFDADRLGIGSSPLDDPTSSRVMVPPTPSPSGLRWLIRLAAVPVPAYGVARLRGIRQAVSIGFVATAQNPDTQSPMNYPVEIDQVSPFWSFVDGNISWHLRVIRGAVLTNQPKIANARQGASVDYETGTDSALLAFTLPPPAALAVGTPVAGGLPPGTPLGALGTFRDLRYPWRQQSGIASFDIEVRGPAVIGLYCSVKQTVPNKRTALGPLLSNGFPTTVLSPEDQFVLAAPNAIYRHVAGSIICDIGQLDRRPGADPTQGSIAWG